MIKYITFDCHDPQALALFWSAALGYEIVNWDNSLHCPKRPTATCPV